MKPDSSVSNPRTTVTCYFEALAALSDDERAFLRRLLAYAIPHSAGSELIAAGMPLDHPRLVISGWACRTRTLPDGRRQILDFYLPGDLMGFSTRPGAHAAASYVTLTRGESAPAEDLLQSVRERPDAFPMLTAACRQLEDQQELRVLNQVIRNGRLTAYERVAHLLLEFYARLDFCGQVFRNSYAMPLTQETLADAVGLSTVHMNRTMQQLRREGLIYTSDGRVTLPDPARLAEAAARQKNWTTMFRPANASDWPLSAHS